jgi:tetratricopeptide (TPR) repeat protein
MRILSWRNFVGLVDLAARLDNSQRIAPRQGNGEEMSSTPLQLVPPRTDPGEDAAHAAQAMDSPPSRSLESDVEDLVDALLAVDTATGLNLPHSQSETVSQPSIAIEEGLAATALAMENYPEVIRHCSRIVQARPDNFAAWFNLGLARQQISELEEAVFAYHQAFRLRPEDPRPLLNLGMVRQALDDHDGAREAYQGALGLDPDLPQGLWNLGLLLERSGSWEEAESLYARLIDRKPDWEDAWFRFGLISLKREHWDQALRAFDSCLARRPSWKEASLNRAIALVRLGRPADARDGFRQVLALEPNCVEALRGLGAVSAELDDWEAGQQARKRLLDLREPLPELTFNLALLLERQKRFPEAIRLYCEALKEQPRFPEALLNLGHVLSAIGKQHEAAECWKRALGLRTEYAAAYFGKTE